MKGGQTSPLPMFVVDPFVYQYMHAYAPNVHSSCICPILCDPLVHNDSHSALIFQMCSHDMETFPHYIFGILEEIANMQPKAPLDPPPMETIVC